MGTEQSTISQEFNANLYTEALELAYPLAVECYKQAERRLDVVEKRLQDLLAFAVTATLGIIAVCAGKVNLSAWQFNVAMVFCVAGMLTGIIARLSGNLILVTPETLYNKYLTQNASSFKMAFVYYAGENDRKNVEAIRKKAFLTNVAAIFFLLEATLLGGLALEISANVRGSYWGKPVPPVVGAAVQKTVAPKVQGR